MQPYLVAPFAMPLSICEKQCTPSILNKEDRDNIFRVCFAACSRELAKLNTAE
jgi:hypothetical protein